MNHKLVCRAALVYKKWLDDRLDSLLEKELSIFNKITSLASDIGDWENLLSQGITRHEQRIINRGVYLDIASSMLPGLLQRISFDASLAIGCLKRISCPTDVVPMTFRKAVEEILAVDHSFKGVCFREKTLSFCVKNIVLSDGDGEADLGDFSVSVHLTGPTLVITAESIDEIKSSGGYYHPHISGEKICLGDGEHSVARAIDQGRLEDALTTIESVLRTYNEDSAYEELSEWYDPDREGKFWCDSCSEWIPYEDGLCCEACGENYCSNCYKLGGRCCECDRWVCGGCCSTCDSCGDIVCGDHSACCSECLETFCHSCRSECSLCDNYFCNQCSEDCALHKCIECHSVLCKECGTKCDTCGKMICKSCTSECCNDCGRKLCVSCYNTDTGCLLREINNEA